MKLKTKITIKATTFSLVLAALLVIVLLVWLPGINTRLLAAILVVYFWAMFNFFKNALKAHYANLVSAEAEGDKPLF